MKYRKTNREKQVSGHCKNNGSCGVCSGNRTYSSRHREPIEADFVPAPGGDYCQECGATADWACTGIYCDACIPRGHCSCTEDEDGVQERGDDGRELPCCDFIWIGE